MNRVKCSVVLALLSTERRVSMVSTVTTIALGVLCDPWLDRPSLHRTLEASDWEIGTSRNRAIE